MTPPTPTIDRHNHCLFCGEEIRHNGRLWAHVDPYQNGRHQAQPRDINLPLRILAGIITDETLDLTALASPAELTITAADGSANDGKPKIPSFNMTAYTGAAMNPGGWYRQDPIVVDLAGMTIPSQSLPIDKDHGTIVGHSTAIEMSPSKEKLKVKGILSGFSPDATHAPAQAAREIVAMAGNGFPYQASIDCTVTKIEKIDPGEKVTVNGQSFTGPLAIARASRLNGVAITAAAADGKTSTSISANKNRTPPMNPEFSAWLKANEYSDTEIAGLQGKKLATLQAAFEATKAPLASVVKPVPAPAVSPVTSPAPEDPILSHRRALAAEDTRIEAIRKICAKADYANLNTLVEDAANPGKETEVSILSHAIAQGWTPRETELVCKREARPRGPIGVFSHSHDSDCTLEALQCAMLLRSDAKNKVGGPKLDILAHPVLKSSMAHAQMINAHGKAQDMVPKFLRAGLNEDARQRAMEMGYRYRDMSIVDLCAEALRLEGKDAPRDRTLRIQAAFSSGALNSIFTTNINVIMLATYSEAPDFTEGWTQSAEVNDFKLNERPRLAKGGPLSKLPRGGEADHTSRSDTEESYRVQRYSRQFAYDEQDAIDDRWNQLSDIPIEMGNAAGRMRPSLVAAIMLANPTLAGPACSLFTDSGTNNNKLVGALSLANFQAACVAMRKFQENGVNLNLEPTHVVVPADLDFAIDQILHSGLIVATGTGTAQIGNMNTTVKVKSEPRPTPYLSNGVTDPDSGTVYSGSTSTWYLVSANAHTIEVGYLKGTGRSPQMRSWMLSQGKHGIGYDVTLDIGAKALDWRGMVQNVA